MENRTTFHLEITSLEDFIAFVAVVRGKDFDLDTVRKLTAKLATSTNDLAAAETAATKLKE